MSIFQHQSDFAATARQMYLYHCNPGAFTRLTPPWESVQVEESDTGISEGVVRHLKVGPTPLQIGWVARHEDFQADRQFVDRQVEGPFKSWKHSHLFQDLEEGRVNLTDRIEYEAPFRIPISFLLEKKLRPMFRYRHRQTARDLELIQRYPGPVSSTDQRPLKIAVTGASGFLGSSLVSFLEVAGHKVLRLTRGYVRRDERSAVWWPEPDLQALEGLDAVIHLAGETVGQLWTSSARERILFSRGEGTDRLCCALARLQRPPKALLSASATGFYAQDSNGPVDEFAESGDQFLSEVCRLWESSTKAAEAAGIRVCRMRIGLVVGSGGGFLAPQLPAFRLGLGAVLGDGQQMQPFIDRDDVVGSIYHLLHREDLSGAFNLTAPQPVTQQVFAEKLATACSRPLWVRVPEAPLRKVLKDQADLLFCGVEAIPSRLLESGYKFLAPTLEESLKHQMGLPD